MNATIADSRMATDHPDDAALRANTYSLLASLLRTPPNQGLLALLLQLDTSTGADTPLESSWQNLRFAALQSSPDMLDDEYHALFIGVGQGEVVPYASWYQTGYLMDKPLANLRQSLSMLGLVRTEDCHEPEDHIAAVCECMAILIDSGSGLAVQRDFYREHLHGWVASCFHDIQHAPSASFYRCVAELGIQFTRLEQRYLDLEINPVPNIHTVRSQI